MSALADEQVAELIREHFVLVASDKWYDRRRRDAKGLFISKLGEQAAQLRPEIVFPRPVVQGMYCFTADGKLLNWRNHRDPKVIRRELETALRVWASLPPEQRKPAAIKVEDRGTPDPRFHRAMPPETLVVNVFMRVLDKKDGEFCKGKSTRPGGTLAARDHLWLLKEEWHALVPADASHGDAVEIPKTVHDRILQYHLCDHTRGHAYAWYSNQVRESQMNLTTIEASDSRLKLKLEGSALLVSDSDDKNPDKGYDVAFAGFIEFDRNKQKFTRFDFVALGEHWGDDRYNGGALPGRTPLGIAFELAGDDDPFRDVPPQGITNPSRYFGK